VPGDQGACLGQVPGRAGVSDGLVDVAGRLVPGCGPPVQHRHQLRLAGAKLEAQQVGEQLVVAVPLAAVVQRNWK